MAILIAGILWFCLPRWIAHTFPHPDEHRFEVEDSYRQGIGKLFGFPLVLITAVGAFITFAQAVDTYRTAQLRAFDEQYQNAFKSLESTEMSTRIGGLFLLQNLLLDEKTTLPAVKRKVAIVLKGVTR